MLEKIVESVQNEQVSESLLEAFVNLVEEKPHAAYEMKSRYVEYYWVVNYPARQEEIDPIFKDMINTKAKFNESAMGNGMAIHYFGFKNEKAFHEGFDYMTRSPEE